MPRKNYLTTAAVSGLMLPGTNAWGRSTPAEKHNKLAVEKSRQFLQQTEKLGKLGAAKEELKRQKNAIAQSLRHIKSDQGIINTLGGPIRSTMDLPIKLKVGDYVRIKSKTNESGEDVVITKILHPESFFGKKSSGQPKYKVMKLAHQKGGPQNIFTVDKKDIIPTSIDSTTLGMEKDWKKLDDALKTTTLKTEQDLGMAAPGAHFYPDYSKVAEGDNLVGTAWVNHQLKNELALRDYVTTALRQQQQPSYFSMIPSAFKKDSELKERQLKKAVRALTQEYNEGHGEYETEDDDGDDDDGDDDDDDPKHPGVLSDTAEMSSALDVAKEMGWEKGRGYKRKKHKKSRKGSRKGTKKGSRKGTKKGTKKSHRKGTKTGTRKRS